MTQGKTKLNQIVAVEKGVKAEHNKLTAPLFHVTETPDLFAGLERTYRSIIEGGEQMPEESKRLQYTVGELLEAFTKPSTRLVDLMATKETTNMTARADVVVDGNVLIKDAPVTFLMPFEKFLEQEVRGLISKLPTLDPAAEWAASESERAGVYATEKAEKLRVKKVNQPLELSPATDKHPAQVQLVTVDVPQGYWGEKRFSGAIPASRKQELSERVETLIQAVKFAREQANDTEVIDAKAGAAVFGYLFS